MNACQRTVGQHGRELNGLPVQCRHQFVADLYTQFGVEALSRHKHQSRGKTAKRVAAQEQACALALLQAQYADGVLGQCGGVDLEQLVARVHIQNRLQRFGCVAVGHHTSGRHDCSDAAAHLGNLPDGSGVGRGCVKTQKAGFAHHRACRIEAFYGYIVQPGGAVHGRAGHGLGDQDQLV